MRIRLCVALATASVLAIFTASDLPAQRPRELRGSRAKLMHQNEIARDRGLSIMENSAMIDRMTKAGLLVAVPSQGTGWYVDPDMGNACGYAGDSEIFRRARPWVLDVLNREGKMFVAALPGSRFKVSGLLRTRDYQRRLRRCNPNAARCTTPLTCSPHMTGSAFDVSKLDMTDAEIQWWRKRLVFLQRCGQVSAMEERATNSFHVFVHPKFSSMRCTEKPAKRKASRANTHKSKKHR